MKKIILLLCLAVALVNLYCFEITAKNTLPKAKVFIKITHNYYADLGDIPFKVRLENISGDSSLYFTGTTTDNTVIFQAVNYGSYEIVVENPFFSTSPSFIEVNEPLITKDISMLVTGSAGGFVFYDKGQFSDGWRYLEAAPCSLEFSAQWGIYTYTGVTNTGVGVGKKNTQTVAEYLNGDRYTGYAAQICWDMNGNREWFLPSRDELSFMYHNLHLRNVGGFDTSSSANYLSGTEINSHFIWVHNFGSGYQQEYFKRQNYRVRAIRAF
ncbi:MAG: DUF1566 domain-containing protein [Candidatus Cloacimonetes bacterium]|nr:DUF1566 domain-containing protein [Candidatus Cloacimonadota bacterium]